MDVIQIQSDYLESTSNAVWLWLNFCSNAISCRKRIPNAFQFVWDAFGRFWRHSKCYTTWIVPRKWPEYFECGQKAHRILGLQLEYTSNARITVRIHFIRSVHYLQCTLQWRHNERDSVPNHQPHDCLRNSLFKTQIKENIKAPRHWPLWGELTGDRWIPRTKDQ